MSKVKIVKPTVPERTEAYLELTNHSPEFNHDAISIIKQEDGNYIGTMWKNGKLITARQGDPTTVLTLLITHE